MLSSGSPIPKKNAPTLESKLKQEVSDGDLKIPDFPSVALEVNRILRNPRSSAEDLAKALSTDEALAMRVIRRANGPNVLAGQGLTSLPIAVARLGRNDIAEIVFAATLGRTSATPGPLVALRKRVWLQSVVCAVLCKRLASSFSVSQDEAFFGGLVHDFGRILVIGAIEKLLEEFPDTEPMRLADWLTLVDKYHLDLGARAAEKWRLPEAVSDTIRFHHSPRRAQMGNRALVNLVGIVDQVFDCMMAAPHVGRDLLAKKVKTPLRGAEPTIAQAIPGATEEASMLDKATHLTVVSSKNARAFIEAETILAADHHRLDAELALDQHESVPTLTGTRDGTMIDGLPGDGLRLSKATLKVDDQLLLSGTALVQGFEDHTECRWFALSPQQKRAWDGLFRSARSS